MFVRWNFTVCWVTHNSFAISSFERPRARALRIEVSRSVSPAAFAPRRLGAGSDRRGAEHVSLDRLSQGGREVARVDALRDVGTGTAAQRRLDELLRGRGGEHHHLHLRIALVDLVQACEPVHVRHPHVQQHEIGRRARDDRQHLGAVLGLAHDLEAAVGLERPANAVQHQPVIICNDDTHRIQSSIRRALLLSRVPERLWCAGGAGARRARRCHAVGARRAVQWC